MQNKIGDAEDFEEPVTLTVSDERMIEIFKQAAEFIVSEGVDKKDFDFMAMLSRKGIRVLRISRFSEENLNKIKAECVSFHANGFCYVDNTVSNGIKMIAFNDMQNEMEQNLTLLHEYAHIHLKHTQQCSLGEIEATGFALAVMAFKKAVLNKKSAA